MKTDKDKSLVEEQFMYQKLQESESHFNVKGDQAADHDDPNLQMSLISTEVDLHPKEDDITLQIILQEKYFEIRDLETQLQALGHNTSKAKLDQTEVLIFK